MMSNALLVFLGAGLGGVLRHGVNLWALRLGPAFPFATFTVNVVGSFLMGLVMAALLRHGGSEPVRLFLATGVLGGFTTFSAFSYDLAALIERDAVGTAAVYAVASVLVALAALYAGLAFGGTRGPV